MRRARTWLTALTAVLALLALALGAGPSATAADEDQSTAKNQSKPDRSSVTNGLKGEYWTQSAPGAYDFDKLQATAYDPALAFNDLAPRLQERATRTDHTTARWTGKLTPEADGEHVFHLVGDNGFRLWVDDELLIDHWVGDWDNEQSSEPVELTGGATHDLKVEYFNETGGSHLTLSWTPPGAEKAKVPASALSLPDDFEYDGPTTADVGTTGRTLELDFGRPMAAPPADLTEHLNAVIGGAKWPLAGVTQDPENSGRLLVTLEQPVVGQGGFADLRYDGEGGLADAEGEEIGDFWTSGDNNSTYQLRTKWADEVGPDNALPEYPRPQLKREQWQNLNGTWQFSGAEEGEAPPIGKKRKLDEEILVPYPVESELSGIERHEERMWYKRSFEVPEGWEVGSGKRLKLHFDAVDWQATVHVNGEEVATHKGGYDRFSVDVTDALSGDGPQELVVGVYDPTDSADGENPPVGKQRLKPEGIWYTPSSGIWGTVWMEPVAENHTTHVKTTPDIDAERVAVQARGVAEGTTVTAVALDGDKEVGRATGTGDESFDVAVPEPRLWSPDDPHLYTLKVTVGEGDSADTAESYFGMRKITVETVDGEKRTVLNGKPVFSMATLDQGFWPEGLHTPPTDEALAYDLEVHKQLGFNSVRKHIKVESDRWFHHADRLGLLVWQDMPSMRSDREPDEAARAQYETELKRMIQQHDSSPSVIMWVTFNEGWGQYDQARIADYAKELDPSRLVNNMSGHNCCGAVDGGNGDISDAHGYPSPLLPDSDGTRALVTGEYGGLGLAIPGHAWPVRHTYVGVEKDIFTEEYLTKLGEVEQLAACRASSGAVYTQISDLEGELNGLLTYDRKVLKGDTEKLKAAHEALIKGASEGTLDCTDS
ncbi:PA14 domain-containing protein [Streptomyces sp. XM4193]|uniref:PA14 domain-containing protein n=1 Tax=Streptomyces sp. XM4193 TaxID=2929782 RepID=UPI001FF8F58B|nr:PA14 domain-containing protein [Streptomyces sp. XM4193]MCK1797458.1 PA14 domain-containing protein [Streptomyces sp. XM4193]